MSFATLVSRAATPTSHFYRLMRNMLTSLPSSEVSNTISVTCGLSVSLGIEIAYVVGEMFAFLPLSGRPGEWEFSNTDITLLYAFICIRSLIDSIHGAGFLLPLFINFVSKVQWHSHRQIISVPLFLCWLALDLDSD